MLNFCSRFRAGFSMLELSIVLIIVALVTAMGVKVGIGTIEQAHYTQTNNKLDQLEAALMAYRVAYNRLPCPADAALPQGNVNYGVESVSDGSCGISGAVYNANGVRTAPSAAGPTPNYLSAANQVVEGAIPFKTLGLPEEFMYDAWGRKFAYAVNYTVTAANVMTGMDINAQCSISGADASIDSNPGIYSRTTGALYVLVSYGPDGHGGYLRSGLRYSSGSANADEQANCHCGASLNDTPYAADYIMKDADIDTAKHPFDDIVRMKERWQMQTYNDSYLTFGGPVCHTGFYISGVAPAAGTSIASILTADINGDGIDDLIVANGNNDTIYVIFGAKPGAAYPAAAPFSVGTLDGTNGFVITAANPGDGSFGISLAAGDIDGDGIKDLIIGMGGAPADAGNGYTYVIFGGTGPKGDAGHTWSNSTFATSVGNYKLDLQGTGKGFINGTNGFRIDGLNLAYAGFAVAAGDIDGDGKDDLIIGGNGKVYVVFGGASPRSGGAWQKKQTLSNNWLCNCTYAAGPPPSNAVNGFVLSGNAGDQIGHFGIATGDINGDGLKDIVMESWSAPQPGGPGRVYVVFGKKGFWPTTQQLTVSAPPVSGFLDGVNGFRLDGVLTNSWTGQIVATGDINGDGFDDLVINAPVANDASGSAAGVVYIVFGKSTGWAPEATLDTGPGNLIDGVQGFRLDGNTNSDQLGMSISVADVNGDGYADLILSTDPVTGAPTGGYGGALIVYGRSGNWPTTTTLGFASGIIDGTQGIGLGGANAVDSACAANNSNFGALAAGDVNGDGSPDILCYSDNLPTGNTHPGVINVIYGQGHFYPWAVTNSLGNLY